MRRMKPPFYFPGDTFFMLLFSPSPQHRLWGTDFLMAIRLKCFKGSLATLQSMELFNIIFFYY